MKLVGYAATFNSPSLDLGGFREIIAPGAFRRSLRNGHTIFAVHSHDYADVMGSTRSGSLSLSEDGTGLLFELSLPDTTLGRDVHALVKRGDLAHMSFSFNVNGSAGESWRELPNGDIERTLKDVNLYEVSTVASPAYPSSSVSARALMNEIQSKRTQMHKRYMQAKLRAIA